MAAWWPAGLAALAAAGVAVALLARFASRLPHDRPGARSLHALPVPRVGGLAIWAGVLAAFAVAPEAVRVPPAWALAWAAVTLVSAFDDWRGVRPAVRLVVQLAAAVLVASGILGTADGVPLAATGLAVAGAAVGLAWAANLYNFMDGSDGVAAAMTVFGFGAYAFADAGGAGALCFAVAAATLPFLAANAPPARMFMGDAGAVPLGFLAATIGLAGWHAERWPAWFPLLVFLPFVADATVTLVRRLWRRERVWEAHRSHYYQRLHRLGAGHRGTLLAWGGLALATAASAVATLLVAPGAGWVVLAAWSGVLAAGFAAIDYHWGRQNRNTDPA